MLHRVWVSGFDLKVWGKIRRRFVTKGLQPDGKPMVATMRENDRAAPVVELEFRKTPTTVDRAAYIMKPSPVKEKPPEWRFYNYTSNCIALDRLVEVALSLTGTPSEDSSFRNNATTPETQLVPSKFYPSSRDGSRDGEGGEDDGDSAEKRRYCCSSSNGIKVAQPAAPSPSSSSPSPSSEAPNHHQSAGYFQQQQQKLKKRLSSFNEISAPAGRSSSSSLRVHVQHPHAKRFKLTPRFKALVDISC